MMTFRLLFAMSLGSAIAGCAENPPFEYGNTYDEEDRAILAFVTDDDGNPLPGWFASLNGRKFAEPPQTAFVKPGLTKVGYYCSSPDDVHYLTFDLRRHRAYAFHCVDGRRASVDGP